MGEVMDSTATGSQGFPEPVLRTEDKTGNASAANSTSPIVRKAASMGPASANGVGHTAKTRATDAH